MWDWFTSIFAGLGNIAESIISLPVKIIDGIINGLKEIFIPDYEDIKTRFNEMLDNVSRSINLNASSVEGAFDSVTERPVEDIKGNYNIPGLGTFTFTFLDTDFFQQGVDYFRPIIRGFIVLMLFFYNYKQVLSFIGQDPTGFVNASKKIGGGDE